MRTDAFLILVFSTAAAALFSALHIALVDLARSALEDIASVRNRARATQRIQRILKDTPGHAGAVALPRTLFKLITVVAMIVWIASLRGADAPGLIDVVLGLVVSALLLWVFCTALPMSLAWYVGERMVYASALLIRATYVLTSPMRPAARFLDEVVRRLSGMESRDAKDVLEAELLSVIEEGEREGRIDESERDMIEAVVEFRTTTVEQIMTPRTEIDALEATDDLGEIVSFVKKVGHSRIPVYEQDLDHVLGVLYAKDLLGWVSNGKEGFEIRKVLRPALFVPETKTVRELLRELIEKKVHLAMVADEYGGTAGLVTIEDIVEEIVGEIQDEYEPEDEEPPRVTVDADARTAEADARLYIDDFNDAVSRLGVSVPEGDDYDTLGGFIITTLGRIPEQGETFRHDGMTMHILEATPTRVVRVRVEVREQEREPGEPETKGEGAEEIGGGDGEDSRTRPSGEQADAAGTGGGRGG